MVLAYIVQKAISQGNEVSAGNSSFWKVFWTYARLETCGSVSRSFGGLQHTERSRGAGFRETEQRTL